jgi:hypothetical protein
LIRKINYGDFKYFPKIKNQIDPAKKDVRNLFWILIILIIKKRFLKR